jgi:hypothetical protein
MAMNLSVAAADMYNGFDDITWIGDFEESIICDLDLSTTSGGTYRHRTAVLGVECRTSHMLPHFSLHLVQHARLLRAGGHLRADHR